MSFQISIDQIITISEARNNLSRLVDEVVGNKAFIITKGGKAKSALVDIDYLEEMERKKDFLEMEKIAQSFQKAFRKYLKRKEYNPDKISDKQAEKLLASL